MIVIVGVVLDKPCRITHNQRSAVKQMRNLTVDLRYLHSIAASLGLIRFVQRACRVRFLLQLHARAFADREVATRKQHVFLPFLNRLLAKL